MAAAPGPVGAPGEPPHACRELRAFLDDPRLPVEYDPQFREYWMPVAMAPGQAAVRQLFVFCPWCGAKLPASLDEKWWDELADVVPENIPPHDPQDWVPAAYRSDAWWRGRFDELG
jgi:hypothetical protein